MITSEEASLIIRKWWDDRTPVLFDVSLHGFQMMMEGFISGVDDDKVQVLSTDATTKAVFLMSSAIAFEYIESKDVPALKDRPLNAGGLAISLRSRGERVAFLERG